MTTQEAYIKFNNNYTATIKDVKSFIQHPLYLNHTVTSVEIVGFSDDASRIFKKEIGYMVQVQKDEIKIGA